MLNCKKLTFHQKNNFVPDPTILVNIFFLFLMLQNFMFDCVFFFDQIYNFDVRKTTPRKNMEVYIVYMTPIRAQRSAHTSNNRKYNSNYVNLTCGFTVIQTLVNTVGMVQINGFTLVVD